METENVSSLKHYSLGIVVQDKAEGSDIIKVDPIESFTLDQGKIREDSRKYQSQLADHKGQERSDKLIGGSVIEAKWIAYGYSNRESAPDVYKNETVILYRFANDQRVYWTTIFREPLIRRLETVVYAYSNQPKGLVEYDPDTSYWEKWDTRRKVIHRHTSDNDGEPFKYDIITNAKVGWHLITDDVGNFFRLDSSKTTNTLINAAGTYIVEEKERLFGFAPDYICFSSPTIYLNTPNLVVGNGGCGTAVTATDYHDKPFIRLNDGENGGPDPGSGGPDMEYIDRNQEEAGADGSAVGGGRAGDSGSGGGGGGPTVRGFAAMSSNDISPDGIGRERIDHVDNGAGGQENAPYARIGNAYESYAYYDRKYRYSYSKDWMTEETPLYTINTHNYRLNSGEVNVVSDVVNYSGGVCSYTFSSISLNADVSISGNLSVGGSETIGGSLEVGGEVFAGGMALGATLSSQQDAVSQLQEALGAALARIAELETKAG